MLTAHQHLALLRRFPDDRVEIDEEFFGVFVRFPNGDRILALAGAHSGPASVLPMSAAGYAMAEPMSEDAQAAEAMLREFLGCL